MSPIQYRTVKSDPNNPQLYFNQDQKQEISKKEVNLVFFQQLDIPKLYSFIKVELF
jgi:hypothetical protein